MGIGRVEVELSEDDASRRRAVLSGTEQLAQTGSWDWDLRTKEAVWSDNVFRLFGFEPREVTPTPEFVADRTHPDDKARVWRCAEARARDGTLPALEYRIVRPDGGVRHLRSTLTRVVRSAGRPVRLTGSVQDVTEQRRAQREIAAHAAVSDALVEWTSLDEGGLLLLRGLAEAMEFETGTVWTVEDDALAPRVFWHTGAFDVFEFEAATRRLRVPKGSSLPGHAWEVRTPINVVDLIGFPDFGRVDPARREAAARAGLRGALALPALSGDEVLAVLDFYSREEAELTDRLLRSLTGIAHELGHFLERRRSELQPRTLTAREIEVLQLAADGLSGPEIAARLVVSRATVKTHFENMYGKLCVGDRASAVAKALRLGLIE